MNNFIEEYYIDEKLCDSIIDYFHSNKCFQGEIGGKVQLNVKNSKDIPIQPDDNFYPFGDYRNYLQSFLDQYTEKYDMLKGYARFNINTTYNIQYYEPGGGVYDWHNERMGIPHSNRVLVFMTYLNDVEDGGTEFKYYNLTTKAKKGLTLLWPPDFTHTHRGQISNTSIKYIVTGWFEFNRI